MLFDTILNGGYAGAPAFGGTNNMSTLSDKQLGGIPPLDLKQPAVIETATFALG
jgi:hypothetical protein